jgi:hypothetical protein
MLIRSVDPRTGDSIIIKLWSRPDFKGKVRRLLGIAACNHEARSMIRLSRVGMVVPYPLGTAHLATPLAGYTDVLFMEDLGKCEDSTEFFKRLIREGDESKVLAFEDAMIQMTEQILAAGMIDVDHGFINTVVQASGRTVRLDFEMARQVFWPRLFAGMYGRMLGHIILLHAFAVQPSFVRTSAFAERLRRRLRPSDRVLRVASEYVQKGMADQLRRTGIDMHLSLPWD